MADMSYYQHFDSILRTAYRQLPYGYTRDGSSGATSGCLAPSMKRATLRH